MTKLADSLKSKLGGQAKLVLLGRCVGSSDVSLQSLKSDVFAGAVLVPAVWSQPSGAGVLNALATFYQYTPELFQPFNMTTAAQATDPVSLSCELD